MTPDEKLGLMSEYQFPIDRLGIPGVHDVHRGPARHRLGERRWK